MFIWALRYWYVILSTLLSIFLYTVIEFTSNVWFAVIGCMLYIGCLMLLYYHVYKKNQHSLTIAITLIIVALGSVGILLLIEVPIFRQCFALFLSACIGAIFYIPQRFSAQLAHEYKPWRRMFVSIMTIGMCLYITTLYGLDMFFQYPVIALYALLGSIGSAVMAYAVFRLYYMRHTRHLLIWSGILAIISFQLFLTISYLPLGYLWLGLMYIWMWYVSITLIRFHLSSKGLLWNKQKNFLFGSLASLILLLLFAQWV